MDRNSQENFAKEWIAAWNAHDLEKILSFYADDAQMQSEYIKIIAEIPSGTICGKEQLRAYWSAGFKRLPTLHFSHISTCAGIDSVAIYYKSVGDRLAVEVFHFNENGLVSQAAAHYA